MNPHETASDRDEAAAEWAVRLEERGSDPAVAAAAEAWLNEDPRRRGALLRARAALRYVESAARARGKAPLLTRRRMLIGAGGCAAAAAAAGAVLFPLPKRIETIVGEMRRVPLADGSVALINTDSVVDVQIASLSRRVSIEKGEVWFKVARSTRPFQVEGGVMRVTANGSAFSFRRLERGAEVLVTDGVVEASVAGRRGWTVQVPANCKALLSDDKPPQAFSADVTAALAWREGRIALNGLTLAEAANEFNRYNARKIVVSDSTLSSSKLVGQFRTDEAEAFARAAAFMLGGQVTFDGETILISRAEH